jgi:hypothetical protein
MDIRLTDTDIIALRKVSAGLKGNLRHSPRIQGLVNLDLTAPVAEAGSTSLRLKNQMQQASD